MRSLDALERALDGVRTSMECDVASVGVWDRPNDVLRTVLNVGTLSGVEVARPADELYALNEFPSLRRLLAERVGYSYGPGASGDVASAALAALFNRDTVAAVPVIVDDLVWGELTVARKSRPARNSRLDLTLLTRAADGLRPLVGFERSREDQPSIIGPARFEMRVRALRPGGLPETSVTYQEGCDTIVIATLDGQASLLRLLLQLHRDGAVLLDLKRLPPP